MAVRKSKTAKKPSAAMMGAAAPKAKIAKPDVARQSQIVNEAGIVDDVYRLSREQFEDFLIATYGPIAEYSGLGRREEYFLGRRVEVARGAEAGDGRIRFV